MFSAALAMLVCGCLSVFVPREKLPSIAETLTMWPGSRAVAQHQRLELAAEDERRHRVDQVDLQHLGGRRPPRASAARCSSRAGPPAAGPRPAGPAGKSVRACRPPARGRRAAATARRTSGCPAPGRCCASVGTSAEASAPPRAERRVAPPRRTPRGRRAAGAASAGSSLDAAQLALQQVRVEAGRTAHRLRRVVDEDVQPVVRLLDVPREELHAGRVPQVEPVDLQPVRPVREVGLARVALRRVVGEAGGGDDLRARAQQHQRRLVADLHARAGDQRDLARAAARVWKRLA